MTRAQMIEAILAVADAEFQSEIAYFTHGIEEREYAYDEVSALIDIEDRTEGDLLDGRLEKHIAVQYRRLLKVARQALIQIGYYVPMTQENIDNTVRSDGRSPWVFKLDKVAYEKADDAVEQFPEGDDQ